MIYLAILLITVLIVVIIWIPKEYKRQFWEKVYNLFRPEQWDKIFGTIVVIGFAIALAACIMDAQYKKNNITNVKGQK